MFQHDLLPARVQLVVESDSTMLDELFTPFFGLSGAVVGFV
jgi:hypothetical protein